MLNIGVLISGGGTNLQSIIDNTQNGKIKGKIKLIISNREEAYGLTRGRNAGIESIYLNSKDFKNEREYNERLMELFKEKEIDLIILAGYLRVLSKEFIEAFQEKIINIHPSLIPSFCGKGYYGKKVHEEVIKSGVKITGASVHFVDEGTDTGPIILQDIVYVDPQDTVDTLQKKVLEVEHKLLGKAVEFFCEGRLLIEGRKVIIKELEI